MADYPPYVNAYNSIPKLFGGIKTAAVPAKVTQDFLESVLDLKSSSHRALIPLLKKLGFIDQANAPTQAYRDFRDDSLSGGTMAAKLREAYTSLFAASEYAWRLSKSDLLSKLRNVTGAGEDDKYLPSIAATFTELSKLASWDGTPRKEEPGTTAESVKSTTIQSPQITRAPATSIGLSYTINLNLPATTEIEVFNAIFKSLRENLLRP